MNELANLASNEDDQIDTKGSEVVAGVKPLLAANMAALEEGRLLLVGLPDELYTAACKPAFQSFIGAHFRHLLEHYQCFISACEMGRGSISICYDTRPRVAELEQNRTKALQTIDQLSNQLCALNKQYSNDVVCIARDQAALGAVASTLARELLFLQAHTIHHHAMIAAMCRLHGVEVEEGFGVAIATQAFHRAQEACSESRQSAGLHGVDD